MATYAARLHSGASTQTLQHAVRMARIFWNVLYERRRASDGRTLILQLSVRACVRASGRSREAI